MNIAIYPRKSVYRDTSDSVEVQVKLCKEYANIIFRGERINFIVYDKDEGFSGKNTNRPSFTEMMNDVKEGFLDVVMVYKLDRISRNVQDFSQTFSILQKHNVSFLSVKESFDTSTPIGRTVMYILAAFSQLERETTAERVSDNMLSMAKAGKWTGGRTPAGMTSVQKIIDGKKHSFLQVDPQRIGFVADLYTMFLSGMSITRIRTYCKNNGIKTPTGKFLDASQIHQILTNPVYCQNSESAYEYLKERGCSMPEKEKFDGQCGLIGYGRTKVTDNIQPRQKMDQWTIAVGIHDWVISGDDWVSVQNRMGKNKTFRSNKYKVGILKGVLRCKCGSRCVTKVYNQGDKQYRSYLCAARDRRGKEYCDMPHIRLDDLDDMFIQQLKLLRMDKDSIKPRKIAQEESFDLPAALLHIEDLEKKIENLTGTLQEYTDSSAAKYIILQINALDEKIQQTENAVNRYKMRKSAARAEESNIDYIYKELCSLLDNFDELSYEEKNETIKKIVKECVFDGEELKIIF